MYLGPWRSSESEREYRRLIAEDLAAGGRVPSRADGRLSVAELVLAWWRHLEAAYPSRRWAPVRRPGYIRSALR